MGATLSIRLFGGFQILHGEKLVSDLRALRLQALLAYLVLHQGTPQSRQHMSFLFWPDSTEKQARTNLRKALYQLRRALPAADRYLVSDRRTVHWQPGGGTRVDVLDFERALARARQARAADDIDREQDALGEAVRCYRGDLCPGQYEDWILARRERLRQQYLEALERLSQRLEGRSDYRGAIRCAETLLHHNPLHEATYRRLMRLHAAAGQPAEALRLYQTCQDYLWQELEVQPSAATQELYHALLRDVEGRTPPNNLPAETTAFVGRTAELKKIIQLLGAPDCRLLTLTGPGGIGKTRLALQVAWQVLADQVQRFPDGAYFASMGAVISREALVATIAGAVGCVFYSPPQPEKQLLDYLRARSLLLILDNVAPRLEFENSGILLEILQEAPHVKLLITSRARLNLRAEWTYPVAGLSCPAPAAGPEDSNDEALQLFAQSARRARAGFLVTNQNYPAIVRICQLVDGIPLGIEMAAAWVQSLTCGEIAAEIDKSLDFLAARHADVPARQRSLRAVLAQALATLPRGVQRLFEDLAVFPDSFTKEAAIRVAGAGLGGLTALVEQSLLKREPAGRYALHDLLQRFATEKLDTHPRRKARLQDQHSRYYLEFLIARGDALRGAGQLEAVREISAEFENIRVAWGRGVRRGLVAETEGALDPLFLFCELRSWFQEALAIFEGDAAHLFRSGMARDQERLYWKIQARRGGFQIRLGRYEQALELLPSCLDTFRAKKERVEVAHALNHLGVVKARRGRFDEAQALCRESLEIFEALQALHGLARVLNNLGGFARAQGDFSRALEYYRDSLARHRQMADRRSIAGVLNNLGNVALDLGDRDAAQGYYQESLEIRQELDDRRGLALTLNNLGFLAGVRGDAGAAREAYQRSQALFTEIGDRWGISLSYNNLGTLHFDAGQYRQAGALYERSLAIKRAIADRWGLAYTLDRLGRTALALDAAERARSCFREALELAVEIHAEPLALSVLVNVAELLGREGQIEAALPLLAAAQGDPAAGREVRDRAEKLLPQVRPTLRADALSRAQESGERVSPLELGRDTLAGLLA
jgi:DNA-binding SARP family transcriptional activator/predicted ATPase/Tfp pilus assembly protein PilF